MFYTKELAGYAVGYTRIAFSLCTNKLAEYCSTLGEKESNLQHFCGVISVG
jgi:hypothetical protein